MNLLGMATRGMNRTMGRIIRDAIWNGPYTYVYADAPAWPNDHLRHRAIRAPPQHLARQRAGVRGVLHHQRAVDDHRRARAARELVRVGVGGAVAEIRRVEDRDVGAVALLQQPAV